MSENETEKPDNMDYYLLRGGMSWGKDDDLSTAFWNWFKNERPKNDTKVIVHQVAKSVTVSGMGGMNWFTKDGDPKELGEIIVTKKFIDKYNNVMGDLEELLLPVEDKFDWDLAMRADPKVPE